MRFWARIAPIVLFVVPTVAAEDWPMFRNDETHQSFAASNTEFGVFQDAADTPNGKWWSVSVGSNVQIESSPVVANGKLFVGGSNGRLYAFDSISGSPLWNYTVSGARVIGSPVVTGGKVFFVTDTGILTALNAVDGAKFPTTYTVGKTSSSLVVHNNKIFVSNDLGEVHSVDASTLNPYWKFQISCRWLQSLPGQTSCSSSHASAPITGPPAIYDSKVYFGAWNNKVYAIKEDPDQRGSGLVSLEVWSYNVSAPVLGSPAIDPSTSTVMVGSNDGWFYALDAQSGSLRWKMRDWDNQAQNIPTQIESSPAVAYGKVFYGANNNKVIARTISSGSLAWEFIAGNDVRSSPAVANNFVLVGSQDRKLYLLNASDGAKRWEHTAADAFKASPAITGSQAFAASFDGAIYSFGKNRPARPDLAIDSVSLGAVYAGQSASVSVSVRNLGNLSAPSTMVRVFLGSALIGEQTVAELAAQGSNSVTMVWTPTSIGTFTLRAIADANNVIGEFDEANNVKEQSVSVQNVPPQPTNAASSPGTPSLAAPLGWVALAAAAVWVGRRR